MFNEEYAPCHVCIKDRRSILMYEIEETLKYPSCCLIFILIQTFIAYFVAKTIFGVMKWLGKK